MIIGAYVDDLLVMSSSDEMIISFKEGLAKVLDITDKGELKEFSGITVERKDGQMTISQRRHIDEMLEKFGMAGCNGCKTPMSTLAEIEDAGISSPEITSGYQSMIGSLMYIAGATRPDIQFVTNKLARFMSAPAQAHLKAVKRVLRYLSETKNEKLSYKADRCTSLTIHADADFANGEDSKSISGIATFYGGNLIDWSSTKQQLVALSTCESEINAVKDAATDAVYFRELLNELMDEGYPEPIIIFNDNLPAKEIVEGGGKFKRTKHYKIRNNYLKQLLRLKIINIDHLGTNEMIADAFTKALPENQHRYLFAKAGMSREFFK